MTGPSNPIAGNPPESAYRWLAAPPLNCSVCGRRIGKTAGHYLLHGDRLACTRCVERPAMHARVFPDCPPRWHDLLDHLDATGTRAGIAARLGLWPTRKATT